MLPMMSLNLIGGLQDAFMEALMCFGAGSCSIEDAHLGAPQEQEIFSDGPVPWTGDKRQLWNEVKIHIQGYLPYESGTVITSILCLMQFK
jgi:hypothetical protein